MTDKQQAFIRRLISERQVHPEILDRLTTTLDVGVDKAQASAIIDWLLAQPHAAQADGGPGGLDLSSVPSGRYAVGDVLFKVDNLVDESNDLDAGVGRQKWAGWVFVKNGSQYTDERFGSQRPGGTYRGAHNDLLIAVVENPTAASQHYGQITGHCGVCGRPLEDEVSVARGIGPVCWERVA